MVVNEIFMFRFSKMYYKDSSILNKNDSQFQFFTI